MLGSAHRFYLANFHLMDFPKTQKTACPHCGSLVWERLQRTKLQRLLRPQQARCYCRTCQQEFWKALDGKTDNV